MTEEFLTECSFEGEVFQTLDSYIRRIQEKAPNLSSGDYSTLVYSVIGYHLGKCKYFGLKFPLEDSSHITELEALSNDYIEIRDGAVRMGVLNLENLEKILSAFYLRLGIVQIE